MTERNWLKAAGLVLGASALFSLILVLEMHWRPAKPERRLVYDPVETPMRVIALPHFVLGLLFLATSRGMRGLRPKLRLLGLAAAGGVLCWLFSRVGGHGTKLGQALVLVYFAVHEFRDEAFFYVANGDAPKGSDVKRLGRHALLAPAALLWLGAGVIALGGAFELPGLHRYAKLFGSLPQWARYVIGPLPLVGLGLWMVRLKRRCDREFPGSVRALVRTYRPLFFVVAGIAALVGLEIAAQGKVRALVTVHVTAWYVFVMYQISKRPPPVPAPRPFSWSWMRGTPKGFTFLHAGLAVLTLAGCAVAAYGFHNSPRAPWVLSLVSRQAFPYWTILHITVSFVPRA